MSDPGYHRLLLFVPEGNRDSDTIPVDLHDRWVVRLLRVCADLFDGATAYGRGAGVWKDSRSRVHWDRVTVIESWIAPSLPDLQKKLKTLGRNLEKMRAELRQEAVGCILDGGWTWYTEEERP